MSLLQYLDNRLEQIKDTTGEYPVSIELSLVSVEKLKIEIKEQGYQLEGCWSELEPFNYRGILLIEEVCNG